LSRFEFLDPPLKRIDASKQVFDGLRLRNTASTTDRSTQQYGAYPCLSHAPPPATLILQPFVFDQATEIRMVAVSQNYQN